MGSYRTDLSRARGLGASGHGASHWISERVSAIALAPLSRNLLVGGIGLACLVLAAASVFFIVRLALGSAPLPAGLGI